MAGKGKKSKDEYPPLLEEGMHPMSAGKLKALVVDGFPKSTRRSMLGPQFGNYTTGQKPIEIMA